MSSWPITMGSITRKSWSVCVYSHGVRSHLIHGFFCSDCMPTEPSKAVQSDEDAKKLWDMSIQLVGLKPSEIHPKLC